MKSGPEERVPAGGRGSGVKVLVVGGVVVAVALLLLVAYVLHLRADRRGDMDAARERKVVWQLDRAAYVMSTLGTGDDPDELDLLGKTSRERVTAWLADFDKLKTEIERKK